MQYFIDFFSELKAGTSYPVYLFYGEEKYLIKQATMRLREYLLPPGGAQLNYQVLDEEQTTVLDVVGLAQQMPFVPGRQLVQAMNPGFIPPAPKKQTAGAIADEAAGEKQPAGQLKSEEKIYLDYLKDPAAHTCIVLVADYNPDKRKKVYKETVRVGKVVECTRLKLSEVRKWLNQRARQENCVLETDAARLLFERCGPDLYTLNHEFHKLTCFVGPGQKITEDAVRCLVTSRAEESIFEVVDAIGMQDARRALTGIRNLVQQKYPPERIMGMVARQFRLILQVGGLRETGQTKTQILAVIKMPPFVYDKISRQYDHLTMRQWSGNLHQLLELDHQIKTGRQRFEPAMETLILKICAKKQ